MTASSISNISLFKSVNPNTQTTNGNVGRNAGAATQGANTATNNAGRLQAVERQTTAAINTAQPQVTNAFNTQITGIKDYIGQFKASGPASSGMDFSTAFSPPASGGITGGFDITAATGALNASATDTASNFLAGANTNFGIAQGALNTADLATNAFGSGADSNKDAASGFGDAAGIIPPGLLALFAPDPTGASKAAGLAMLLQAATKAMAAFGDSNKGNKTAKEGVAKGNKADADLEKAGAGHDKTAADLKRLKAEQAAIAAMMAQGLAPTQQLATDTTNKGLQLLGNQASGQPSGFFVGGAPPLGGTAGLPAGPSDWETSTSTAPTTPVASATSTTPTSPLATAGSDWGTSVNRAKVATASLTPATNSQDQGGLTPQELAFLNAYYQTNPQIASTNTEAAGKIGGLQQLQLNPGQFHVSELPPEVHALAQQLEAKRQAQANGGNQDIAMMPPPNPMAQAGGVGANGQPVAGNPPNGAQNGAPTAQNGAPTAPGQPGPQGSQAPPSVATAPPVAYASWEPFAPATAPGLTIPQAVAKVPATPVPTATLGSFV